MQIGSPVSDAAYMYANVNVNVVVLNAWQLVLVISLHIQSFGASELFHLGAFHSWPQVL